MALQKKERRFTIAIGLIIGVTISSMIVRHALSIKEEQSAQRPGNYNSQFSASGNVNFPALPNGIKQAIPNGIVVYFEGNRSSITGRMNDLVDCWVIETSGSFRSERLFILAETDSVSHQKVKFLRSSEIYVTLNDWADEDKLNQKLDSDKFHIIGRNTKSGEYIVQVRNFSPTELDKAKAYLNSLNSVKSTRFVPWRPNS